MGKIYQNGKIYGSNDMHAIFNDGGIELTKRPSIQFKGAYSKDDSADNITEVNVIREMTQQEFDQLSSDEKQGLINVVDATDGFNNAFQPVIYSKEEREIGVWIDGKPLYEKTVEWSNSTAIQPGSSLAHNIANIDLVVDYDVFISRESGTSIKFSWSTTSNASTTVSVDKTNVMFAGTDNWPTSTYVKLYAVIRYTKTTDTPGSGKWTSNGVPAVHYSTEEQVVGTWTDGKTLYEKTFTATFTNIAHGTPQNMTDVSGLGIADVIRVFGSCKYDSTTPSVQPTLYENLGGHFFCYVFPSGYLQFGQTMTSQTTGRTYEVKITIQYTKSST